jgi:phosphoribosylformylglycinamidine (FGAM) synthase PurS component
MPRFILSERDCANPKNKHLLAEAHALGFDCLEYIECHNVYYFADELSIDEQDRLSRELLIDSFTQEGSWEANGSASVNAPAHTIEVVFRPGVTDAVANEIARHAQSLGIDNAKRIATGQRFFIYSKSLSENDLSLLAEKLLCNTVIQQYSLHSLSNVFADQSAPQNSVQSIQLIGCSTEQLGAISEDLNAHN